MDVISDTPEQADAAIELSKSSKTEPFVSLMFYHAELPPSLFTASLFQKFRSNFTPESVGKIFLLDAACHSQYAAKFGVIPTPALIVIWKGNPLQIRRPGWDDSAKVIGCMPEEEWLSILRFMAALPKTEERKFLSVNFS
jgi:hypothetical protein